ncbi:MAG TPA: EF-hand domain-containing protein [Caulobacteraceae bacterium]
MFATRRRFAAMVSGSIAAAGLLPGAPARARGADEGPPNVFFSPHGRPFRAVSQAPYPVADWFKQADRNGDGKLDREEFVADAAAFFDALDQNADGALGPEDIAFYERSIAPEVLGMRVTVLASGELRVRPAAGARLWLAQYGPMEGGPMRENGPQGNGLPGNPGGYSHGGDPNQGAVLPDGVRPNSPDAPGNPDADLTGAAPYGFFREPEPVTAADPDYLFTGAVSKARFLAHAGDNFARLDVQRAGYLTLAGLPQSPVQRQLGRLARR